MVPDPAGGFLVTFDPDGLVGAEQFGLFLGRGVGQVVGEARPDDQDVAVLEGGALVLGDGLEVLHRDGVGVEARVLDALGPRVLFVVEEHAAADQSAPVVPVVQSGQGALGVEAAVVLHKLFHLRFDAVVVETRRLVGIVHQAVPLGGALGVELDLVVEAVEVG